MKVVGLSTLPPGLASQPGFGAARYVRLSVCRNHKNTMAWAESMAGTNPRDPIFEPASRINCVNNIPDQKIGGGDRSEATLD